MEREVRGRGRIEFIHALRGIAPMLVFFAHIPGWWLSERKMRWPPFDLYVTYLTRPLNLNIAGGHLGVSIFFLISGFIISASAERENRFEFAIKRLFRIYPALFAAMIAMYAIAWLADDLGLGPLYGNDTQSVRDFVVSALLLNWLLDAPEAIDVTWSLVVEMTFYAIMFALLPLVRKRPVASTLAMLGIYLVIMLPGIAGIEWLDRLSSAKVLPLLIIGRIFYLMYSRQISPQIFSGLIAVTLGLFISVMAVISPETFTGYQAKIYTYALAITIFAVAMWSSLKRCPPVLSFLANISYPLYLIHIPVGMFTLSAFDALGASVWLSWPVALALTILAATGMNRYVERPGQQAARKLVAWRAQAVPQSSAQLR